MRRIPGLVNSIHWPMTLRQRKLRVSARQTGLRVQFTPPLRSRPRFELFDSPLRSFRSRCAVCIACAGRRGRAHLGRWWVHRTEVVAQHLRRLLTSLRRSPLRHAITQVTMGSIFARLFSSKRDLRVLMVGLDAAGKTTILCECASLVGLARSTFACVPWPSGASGAAPPCHIFKQQVDVCACAGEVCAHRCECATFLTHHHRTLCFHALQTS